MLTGLSVLGWLLAGLLGLICLILVVPWHLRVRWASSPKQEVSVRLHPVSPRAPALVRVTRQGPGSATPAPATRPDLHDASPRKRTRSVFSRTLSRHMTRLMRALPGLVADTISGIHLDHLHAEGRFGLGDPAETGQVFGQLCPLLYGPPSRRVHLALTPDFDRPCLEGRVDLALHLSLARLLWPAAKLALREISVRP